MIRFKMLKINVLQFAILGNTCEDSYNVETATEIKNTVDGRAVAIIMTFTFTGKVEKVMVLQVMCEFSIHPDDLPSLTSDGKITIPKGTLEHFLVHTVGTARGILHCKTEGTPFNAVILPPINVTTIIGSDMVIELPKEEQQQPT